MNNLQSMDFEYLQQAEAHADEGPLGEPAARSILKIASRLIRQNIELRNALLAFADAADKCAEAPHYIVQPFLDIYRTHGELIEEMRS